VPTRTRITLDPVIQNCGACFASEDGSGPELASLRVRVLVSSSWYLRRAADWEINLQGKCLAKRTAASRVL